MSANQTHTPRTDRTFRVRFLKETACRVIRVRLGKNVEVRTEDRWLSFWTAGQEVRVGPLTADQCEKLAEDLAYEAIE
jgi:hypothetical protein